MGEVIAASRMAEKVRTTKPRTKAVALSEDSLAQLFCEAHAGLLVYAHSFKQWYIYQPETGLWKQDGMELVQHWVRGFVRDLNKEQKEKWAKASTVAAVEKLARRDPMLAIRGTEFDADPWLLGTPAGVWDLRSGEMLKPSPTHYASKCTAVAPLAQRPELWLAFLAEATNGDVELMGYLQRLAGYCLTGETREEILVFMHGPGGNGKGVFMNAIRDVLGEYAKQAAMQVLLSNNGDRHPTELANLNAARLVLASESPEGKRWDEERVKALTGRDAISARFMNRDFFEFIPQFKLLVASNHKPRIRTVDDAWRRRLHLIPFTHKPKSPNPELKEQMKAEYPAILQWMIEGCDWWIREGLAPPASITEATEEYFKEEDVIGLWFAECCEAVQGATGDRKVLYHSYAAWCKGMGHAAATMHTVTRWFKHRGFEQNIKDSSRPILGVQLQEPPAQG